MTPRPDEQDPEDMDALLRDLGELPDIGDLPDPGPLPQGCDLSGLEALLDWDNLPDLGPLPDLDLPDS